MDKALLDKLDTALMISLLTLAPTATLAVQGFNKLTNTSLRQVSVLCAALRTWHQLRVHGTIFEYMAPALSTWHQL